MLELQDIIDKTNGGKDIFLYFHPEWSKFFDEKKKFSYRDDDKTASAHFYYVTLKRMWIIKDFGGDSINPYDFYRQEKGMLYASFPVVLKCMAADFGVEDKLDTSVNSPRVEWRDQQPGEPDVIFEFDDHISNENLRTLGPNVKAEDAERLHWHQVRFYGHKVKNGRMCIEYATPNYPIFMRECIVPGSEPFYKLYKPKEPDKGHRFLTVGVKPENYLNGLHELREVAEQSASNEEGNPEKLPCAVLCSGERDALCVASLGYHPIWLNSETAQLTRKQFYAIKLLVNIVYNIPDIDDTGCREGCALALEYLDVHTVWLSPTLLTFKDNRGRSMKDFCDWMELTHQKDDPVHTLHEFEGLLSAATPARFWREEENNGKVKVTLEPTPLFNFLKINGFRTLKDEDNAQPRFIRIVGNRVYNQNPKDIRRFIRNWAQERKLSRNVQNVLLHHPLLQDTILEALDEVDLDFTSCTYDSQTFYFDNKAVVVTPTGMKEILGSRVSGSHYVWDKNVMPYSFRKLPPMFKVTWEKLPNGSYDWDISISDDAPSNILKYLINTSRIHWRKELEERYREVDGTITVENEAARKEYHRLNPFRIDGEGLTAEEIHEQKLNLISKLQGIGYLFHRFKTHLHVWGPLLLDHKIGENGQCNGRSGKSFLMKAIARFLNMLTMDGRNEKLMDNNHVFSAVKESTNLIFIDDCHIKFDFNRFYSIISEELTVNPKNKNEIHIPFKDSPKIVFSSNFVPMDFNSSSEGRRFYMVFSDYYHMKSEENDYLENRTIHTDFQRELLDDNYKPEEWNAEINFFLQCLQFYLQVKQEDVTIKIMPPMQNIMQRMRRQQMGGNFPEWAEIYFAEDSDHLDRDIPRKAMQEDYMRFSNVSKITSQSFRQKLEAYCKVTGYCLNPKELLNKDGRILKLVEDSNDPDYGKKREHFHIRSAKQIAIMAQQRMMIFHDNKASQQSPSTDSPTQFVPHVAS